MLPKLLLMFSNTLAGYRNQAILEALPLKSPKFIIFHMKEIISYLLKDVKLIKLTSNSFNEIETYFSELRKSGIYNYLLAQVKKHGVSFSPMLTAPVVYVACRAIKPRIVVETGVGSGFSTTLILQALSENPEGMLYSIDFPSANFITIGRKVGWLVPAQLRRRWTLVIGKSSNVLPSVLKDVGEIDMFLHDSDHSYENMMFEFRAAWNYLKEGGILFSHDVDFNNAFPDLCRHVKPNCVARFAKLGAARK